MEYHVLFELRQTLKIDLTDFKMAIGVEIPITFQAIEIYDSTIYIKRNSDSPGEHSFFTQKNPLFKALLLSA